MTGRRGVASGRLERTTCDACQRPDQRCQPVTVDRDGEQIQLHVCVHYRSCIAATALDLLAQGLE